MTRTDGKLNSVAVTAPKVCDLTDPTCEACQ